MTSDESTPAVTLNRRTPGERRAYLQGVLHALQRVRNRLPPKARGKYSNREIAAAVDSVGRMFSEQGDDPEAPTAE